MITERVEFVKRKRQIIWRKRINRSEPAVCPHVSVQAGPKAYVLILVVKKGPVVYNLIKSMKKAPVGDISTKIPAAPFSSIYAAGYAIPETQIRLINGKDVSLCRSHDRVYDKNPCSRIRRETSIRRDLWDLGSTGKREGVATICVHACRAFRKLIVGWTQ